MIVTLSLLATAAAQATAADATAQPEPPAGFVSLFNGHDLSGWHGLGHFDPLKLKNMTPEQRAKIFVGTNADMKKHWRVENGEIVSDGHGVFLTADKDFGNFELLLDWKMVHPNGDSGIYLRGYPQVQIWDPSNPREKANGAPKGSGGLWNNNADNPGRWPLVKADRPIGEWNSLKIRMEGNRVTVHFNDKLVVDNAVLDNYFDRKSQVLPEGPLQLQTHGSEMRFRNLFIRELPATEPAGGK
jgi:hypothetical protein